MQAQEAATDASSSDVSASTATSTAPSCGSPPPPPIQWDDWSDMEWFAQRAVAMGAEIYQDELGIPYDECSDLTGHLEYLMYSYLTEFCDFQTVEEPMDWTVRFARNLAASVRAQGTSRIPLTADANVNAESGQTETTVEDDIICDDCKHESEVRANVDNV